MGKLQRGHRSRTGKNVSNTPPPPHSGQRRRSPASAAGGSVSGFGSELSIEPRIARRRVPAIATRRHREASCRRLPDARTGSVSRARWRMSPTTGADGTEGPEPDVDDPAAAPRAVDEGAGAATPGRCRRRVAGGAASAGGQAARSNALLRGVRSGAATCGPALHASRRSAASGWRDLRERGRASADGRPRARAHRLLVAGVLVLLLIADADELHLAPGPGRRPCSCTRGCRAAAAAHDRRRPSDVARRTPAD